jgi:hypothetical protein
VGTIASPTLSNEQGGILFGFGVISKGSGNDGIAKQLVLYFIFYPNTPICQTLDRVAMCKKSYVCFFVCWREDIV